MNLLPLVVLLLSLICVAFKLTHSFTQSTVLDNARAGLMYAMQYVHVRLLARICQKWGLQIVVEFVFKNHTARLMGNSTCSSKIIIKSHYAALLTVIVDWCLQQHTAVGY